MLAIVSIIVAAYTLIEGSIDHFIKPGYMPGFMLQLISLSYTYNMYKYRQQIRLGLILLLTFHLSYITYCWSQVSGLSSGVSNGQMLVSIGRLVGLWAMTCLLTQFLLIGRFPFLEQSFGQDRMSRLHQLNGYIAFTLVLTHVGLVVNGNAILDNRNPISQNIFMIFHYPDVWKAFLAEVCLIAIVFSSIWIVRRKLRYEWWYGVHLLTYIAIILVIGHQLEIGTTINSTTGLSTYWSAVYILILGGFVLSRIVYPFALYAIHQFRVLKVSDAGGGAVHVDIGGKHMKRFKFQPGQFNTYTFLTKKMWLQEHPFTINKLYDGESIRITARDVGDYTHLMQSLRFGVRVIVQGPYGVFGRDILRNDKVLMIAGGVGITPLQIIAEEALKKDCSVTLLYANRDRKTIVNAHEVSLLAEAGARVVDVLSDDSRYDGEKGFIDEEKLKRLVPDLKKRKIYICGPPPMMRSISKLLLSMNIEKEQIHTERFSFHR